MTETDTEQLPPPAPDLVPPPAETRIMPGLTENKSEPLEVDPMDAGEDIVAPPGPIVAPPTDEQYAWLAANPAYMRISHSIYLYSDRGTLDPTGTFIAEGPGTPVLDGNGMFGVGIPT